MSTNAAPALKELTQGFALVAIGDEFFKSLAAYLSKTLGVDYVVIGELVPDQSVRSLAFFAHGQLADNIQYPLTGSCCEHVMKSGFYAFPSRVQQQFPNNQSLKHFGIDSYAGTLLFDAAGSASGLIYVMHSQPLLHLDAIESLLTIVAKRAELELARKQQERRLYQANLELMARLAEREKKERALRAKNVNLRAVNETLARTEGALKELNHALEAKVAERTEELNQKNEALTSVNDDLDNFIYTASHDLKAPISNIEGLMKILACKLNQKGWEDEVTTKIADLIHASVARFKETIADLTEITKLQRETGDQATANLTSVIHHALLDFHDLIREADAHVELRLGEYPDLVFSKKNLESIVYNLLSNAIKYRAPDRRLEIRIACEDTEAYLLLSVKDNGLGINAGDTGKVFTMFKRLHDHVEGTGIGLYIVKKILESAGGKIEVESTVDEGSTFRVYFKK
ncbi:MAG: GAF domain-containing sensor histidine kinase [Ferruginibacter sp.]|nr:GAF domain-containing sensor histidine kinase [Cytophagales bacterium]